MAEEHKDLDVAVNQELNQASWIIQGDLMAKFKNADNGEKYSVDFLLHGCSWIIHFYPNGNKPENIDYFSIFIESKTLPKEFSKLGMTFQVALIEANGKNNDTEFFAEGTRIGWSKFMKRDVTMEKLTINVNIFVTTTIEHGCLIWKIGGYLLEMFQSC
eukprot:5224_1